jgi:hypothetical protein
MCIDYTSLKKVCPKDEYPLPHICQIVESTTSCEPLLFLDAYSGYHQINIVIVDEEKNSIHHSIQEFLLHQDRIWPKERGAHIRSVYTSSWKPRLEGTLKPTLMT